MKLFSLLLLFISGTACADSENFLPVELKCPKGRAGTLELIKKNGVGAAERMRAVFDQKGLKSVALDIATKGRGFKEALNYDLRSKLEGVDQDRADHMAEVARGLGKDICQGDAAAKKKFEEELAENRKELRRARSGEAGETDPGQSMSGE